MNDKEIFLAGGFSIGWNEEPQTISQNQIPQRKHKDLDTLKKELEEIKEYIQDIQARQWQIAKLFEYSKHNFLTQ